MRECVEPRSPVNYLLPLNRRWASLFLPGEGYLDVVLIDRKTKIQQL
jgi:hypothetical protein